MLLTRPEIEGRAQGAALEAMGYEVFYVPMLIPQACDFTRPDMAGFQGIIFTSAAGVRFFCAAMGKVSLPVLCVGEATAQAARAHGCADVSVGGGVAEDLVALAQGKSIDDRPFLYVRGVHVAHDLSEGMRGVGITLHKCVAYEAVAATVLGGDVERAIAAHEVDVALFYSKRTAENFLKLAGQSDLIDHLKFIKALCISMNVMEAVRAPIWAEVRAATSPNSRAMQDLIDQSLPR